MLATAQTFTAMQTISLSGSGTQAPLVGLIPSLAGGNGAYITLGQALSAYNSASFGFVFSSSGSSANYLSMALYGQAATLRVYSNRIYFEEGNGIELGTTTGSKIGTGTNQKLGFWNATPIIQPTTSTTAATIVGGAGTTVKEDHTFDGYTIAKVVKALRNAGILA